MHSNQIIFFSALSNASTEFFLLKTLQSSKMKDLFYEVNVAETIDLTSSACLI